MALHVQTQLTEEAPTPVSDKLGTLAGESLHRSLRLTALLQTSLDLATLLGVFHEFIHGFLDHDSAHYHYEEIGESIRFGKPARHHCRYALAVCGENLGELTLSRARCFSPAELEIFENLLCALLYPLRNALLYRQARKAALIDPLTGVQNRAGMDAALAREIELAHRHRTALSLVALDIDHFKSVNDRYGHAVGDQVLKTVVHCINSAIRGSDALYRFGGEEFVLLLNNTDEAGAYLLAERIRLCIARHAFAAGHDPFALTVSLGVSQLRQGQDSNALFKATDSALYRAKETGRNRVVCSPET